MPTPNRGETEREFINRCMGDAEARRDFPDASQRRAFCQSQWERARQHGDNTMTTKIIKQWGVSRLKALDDAGQGTAVIATLNVVDKDGDLTLPGAFGVQEVKVLPAHDSRHVPLGKATIREEGEEVLADFRLNLEIAAARDWHNALKFDLAEGRALQEWSYGFFIVDAEMGEHEGQIVQILKRVKVHEVSPVVVGAGEGTRTVAIKEGGPLKDQLLDAAHRVERALERVAEVQELRAADGRDLAKGRYEQLAEIKAALDTLHGHAERLGKLLEMYSGAVSEDALPDGEAERLAAESLRLESRMRGLKL